jgi:AraC-like DNA-binding protein
MLRSACGDNDRDAASLDRNAWTAMDTRSRSVDVLSDMLDAVRLTGSIFLRATFGVPWAIRTSGQTISHLLRPGAKHVTMFHMITEGRCRVDMPDGESAALEAGDLMLLPMGGRHILRNGDAPVVEADKMVADLIAEGVMTMRHGGDGAERTHVVCGFVQSGDLLFSPVFGALPRLIVERSAEEPVTSLLANTVRHLMGEVEALRPGIRDMLGRLMETLFVELLRRHVARLPPETAGWLGALNEPVVNRALQMIHAQPMADWTVESLAMRVGTSRSVLADRFKATLGQPPMQYLGAWRLQLAMNMLRDGRSIAEIAAEVGYESEAAFSRAFKRHLGVPPGAWREQTIIARI